MHLAMALTRTLRIVKVSNGPHRWWREECRGKRPIQGGSTAATRPEMVTELSNGIHHVELTRDELWNMIDQDARQYLNMDGTTFVRRYCEGSLEDTRIANDIAMLVKLGNFAEKCA